MYTRSLHMDTTVHVSQRLDTSHRHLLNHKTERIPLGTQSTTRQGPFPDHNVKKGKNKARDNLWKPTSCQHANEGSNTVRDCLCVAADLTVDRGFWDEEAFLQHSHHVGASIGVVQRESHRLLHLRPAVVCASRTFGGGRKAVK